MRASNLFLSVADENAAILRPAYCDKQNKRFAFHDLTTTKKCQAEDRGTRK